MDDMTIAALARAGGVGVETVRFYQRRGLLATPSPAPGRRTRRYGGEALRDLGFIRAAQTAGFTLDEIAELRALDASQDRPRVRALAAARLLALEARLAELERARDRLRALAGACAAEGNGPCPILAAFTAPAS